MKKELKDYLHLYLGCECKGKDGSMIYTLKSVDLKSYPLLKDKYGNECVIFDFKPILRPLSDVTKEEVAELLGIDGCIIKGNFCSPFFQVQYTSFLGEHCHKHAYLTQLSPSQFKKLLGWFIDIFGLIESGIAIDKTIDTTTIIFGTDVPKII